jgi:hypothetical protein
VAYLTELFIAWYSGYIYEQYAFYNRVLGPYWWSYVGMMACNVLSPQIFWSREIAPQRFRTFVMSIFVNIGMWFERFVIIATTLARDYMPSSWSYYVPSWVEIGIFLGTLGLFFTLVPRIRPRSAGGSRGGDESHPERAAISMSARKAKHHTGIAATDEVRKGKLIQKLTIDQPEMAQNNKETGKRGNYGLVRRRGSVAQSAVEKSQDRSTWISWMCTRRFPFTA